MSTPDPDPQDVVESDDYDPPRADAVDGEVVDPDHPDHVDPYDAARPPTSRVPRR